MIYVVNTTTGTPNAALGPIVADDPHVFAGGVRATGGVVGFSGAMAGAFNLTSGEKLSQCLVNDTVPALFGPVLTPDASLMFVVSPQWVRSLAMLYSSVAASAMGMWVLHHGLQGCVQAGSCCASLLASLSPHAFPAAGTVHNCRQW